MAACYALSPQNAKTVNMAEHPDMFADFAKGSRQADPFGPCLRTAPNQRLEMVYVMPYSDPLPNE